jgi:hypothetical protein
MNYVMFLFERNTSRVLLGEGGYLNLSESVKKNA